MASDVVQSAARVNIPNHEISATGRDALALVARLSPRELERIRDAAASRLSLQASRSGVKPSRDDTNDQRDESVDWLLCGIEAELRSRGVLGRTARVPVDAVCPKYRKLSRPAVRTLRAALGKNAKPAELAALGRLAAECLADYLEQMRVPVCARTMLQHAGDAAAAIDASFPGYLGSRDARRMLGM